MGTYYKRLPLPGALIRQEALIPPFTVSPLFSGFAKLEWSQKPSGTT